MQIEYHKNFVKKYKKLSARIKEKVDETLVKFQISPFDQTLVNHALKGVYFGKRAISVTGNIRIIFIEEGNHSIVTLLNVGTHNQVY